MKIKTITCHEVYNHGASLQEYALLAFLKSLGHDAQTIHYKPDYLSNHFNLWRISNPRYEKNIILKTVYLIIKLPERLKVLKRKKNFDEFSRRFIESTVKLYKTNEELKADVPEADAFICGSDQIWNSFFPNGKDPSFYLDFVPNNKLKISYAASFAIDKLKDDIKDFVKEKVSKLDHISTREPSGIDILIDLGIDRATQVLDPVFLLTPVDWEKLSAPKKEENYIFVYDCDSDSLIQSFATKMKEKYNCKIVTVNSNIKYADEDYSLEGPDIFLSLIQHAKFVISNSFHAVAFSIIFEKQFTVFNRFEKINTRMRDVTRLLEIPEVLVLDQEQVQNYDYVIDYEKMKPKLSSLINHSKSFLQNALGNQKN
ncbi:polysaccharide pyruvyl transferase [Aquimarina sp. MAR_2010_214]|uniref:polysaccharide pyruvyl transferase family protein n=1 Tax=Aquimarina sp. MAR_2010_214 TaxID=1250026 RepID=UPI000C7114D6|nr:polysaccharide pyruvyl transferase family protein [Aquimarina sp. MAR_2010_214]PKV50976.1 polysaccharide pyruvyl transferase [Aquimarina sp. MAR_2010_214]